MRNAKVFFISDTHFNHKRILEYARPEFTSIDAMNEFIVTQWNRVVMPQDTVWHLGDVCLGGVSGLEWIGRCNGRKNLVKGNHDSYAREEYHKYFNKIVGAAEYKGCILTHIPVHTCQFPRFRLNIHGHMHNKFVTHTDLYLRQIDPRYVNVCVEVRKYTPISFEEIINGISPTHGTI